MKIEVNRYNCRYWSDVNRHFFKKYQTFFLKNWMRVSEFQSLIRLVFFYAVYSQWEQLFRMVEWKFNWYPNTMVPPHIALLLWGIWMTDFQDVEMAEEGPSNRQTKTYRIVARSPHLTSETLNVLRQRNINECRLLTVMSEGGFQIWFNIVWKLMEAIFNRLNKTYFFHLLQHFN